jgi:hypothetical protein
MSKTYQTRPSAFIGWHSDWVAMDFDSAVFALGNYIDGELRHCKTDGDAQIVLRRLLDLKPKPTSKTALLNRPGVRVKE